MAWNTIIKLRSSTILLLVLSGVASIAKPSIAVVVTTTTENTTRPPDDPGWDNIGVVNGSTGIYLGDRWMITAFHVGAGPVQFPNLGTFDHDASSAVRLKNPPAARQENPRLSGETDLLLFRLKVDPGLKPLPLVEQQPRPGDEVLLIGYGKNRQEEMVYWNVDKSSKPWTWTESSAPTKYFGFKTQSSNTLRWGTNLIENDEPFFFEFDNNITTSVEATGDVVALITEFDFDGASDKTTVANDGSTTTSWESQAVLNDSGGAAFIRDSDTWRLAGIMIAVQGHDDQPDPRRNPLFGNLTFLADVSVYRNQIDDRFTAGDFDHDGVLAASDIDQLTQKIRSGRNLRNFDLNDDEKLTQEDRRIWVEELRMTFFGDADLNGQFDTSDLVLVWQKGEYEDLLTGNSRWQTGDWNGDGEFDSGDLITALQSGGFETGARRVDPRSPFVVPEPPSFALVIAASISCMVVWHCFRLEKKVTSSLRRPQSKAVAHPAAWSRQTVSAVLAGPATPREVPTSVQDAIHARSEDSGYYPNKKT